MEIFRKKVIHLLKKNPAFYYLIHPADFLGKDDMVPSKKHSLSRMDIAIEEKMGFLEMIFNTLSRSGRKGVTMLELCKNHEKTLHKIKQQNFCLSVLIV